ncbi:MAG TPA: cupredoxin domain-containing protein [Acidimicrobiales bacterium]|nr:cupredoxin domain-containing protein [Acidimicrobiales bacterium]
MVNLATKLYVALSGVALVAAIGYGVVVGDRAGADLLAGVAGAAAVLALVAAFTLRDDRAPAVPADAPAPERRNAYTEADAPAASAWPLVAALSLVSLALATAAGASWLGAALAATLIPLGGWLSQVWREHPSFTGPVQARVVERLVAPLAMPVLGVLGALFIAVMVSRVLLAISTTASWVTALVLAAGLVVVLWFIASRPRLQPSALVGIASVALVGMVAAGAIGAKAGEREFHPEPSEIPTVAVTAKDVQFSLKEIKFPAGEEVIVKFQNDDVGTYHNVAFYTSTEPGSRPLFNGKPIPGGRIQYDTHTPAPGSYAFVCDFHPTTMTGTLVITPAESKTAGEETTKH